MTQGDHISRARADRLALFSKYRPVERELNLADVLARGLIDNLDHRLAMMEAVLEEHRLTRVQYDMLPSLAAEAGYDWRDKEAASTSISLLTGTPSLQPSYSSERSGIDANLRFSWNLLDFGLSYFQAKQQSDRVLIAVETRRRVLNNTTRDIISAYYRALAAEKLLPRVRKGIADTQKAIDASDKARDEKLVPAAQMLSYKRDLLQYLLTLRNHEASLQRAREELATLINVPIDQLKLARSAAPALPRIATPVTALQDYALVNRAELREEAYRERIERQAVYQETLRLFPGLSALGSFNYDSNKYLYYSNWRELGLRATYNLLDVAKAVQDKKTAEAQVEYTQMRRIALSAAILAQTAISYYQYQEARSTNRTAGQLSEVEGALLQAARDAEEAQVGSVLERIRQQTASVSAQIEEDRSYAEAQTALAGLLVSIGYDFVPAAMDVTDPDVLAEKIAPALADLHAGRLPSLKAAEDIAAPSADDNKAAAATVVAEPAPAQKKGFWRSLFSRDADVPPAPAETAPVVPVRDKRTKADIILDAWRKTEGRGAAPVSAPTVAPAQIKAEEPIPAPSDKPGFFQRLFGPRPAPPAVVEPATPVESRALAPVAPAPTVAKEDIVWEKAPEPTPAPKKPAAKPAPTPAPKPAPEPKPVPAPAPKPEPKPAAAPSVAPPPAPKPRPEEKETEVQPAPAAAPTETAPDVPRLNVRTVEEEAVTAPPSPKPAPKPVKEAEPPKPKPAETDAPAPALEEARIAPPPAATDPVAIPVQPAPPRPVMPLRTRAAPTGENKAQALEAAEIEKYIKCADKDAACGLSAASQDDE